MPVQIEMAKPADLAGEWLAGVKTGQQIKEAKQQLEAQQAEVSARLQAQAQQNAQDRALEQQKLAVTQAYHRQQIDLRKEQLNQAEQVNAQKTQAAAKQFEAKQAWAKGNDQIDNNPNLTDEQKDAAKTKLIMSLAPQMGMAGTEASSMLRDLRPLKAQIPASVKDVGDFVQVTQPNGQIILHPKPKVTAEKTTDPNVKVNLPGQTAPITMSRSQAQAVIPTLPKELQDDPVNKSVMSAGAPRGTSRQAVGKYKIGATYKGGLKYLGGDPTDEASWQKVQ